jgi:hypothetical protein
MWNFKINIQKFGRASMKVNFVIDGKPQGKGRHRLSYGGIKIQEETVIYEN